MCYHCALHVLHIHKAILAWNNCPEFDSPKSIDDAVLARAGNQSFPSCEVLVFFQMFHHKTNVVCDVVSVLIGKKLKGTV